MLGIIAWVKGNVLVIAIASALIFAAMVGGYKGGERAATARYDAARALANVETVKVDGAAKEIAANERRVDDTLVNEGKERLLDAVQSAPESAPDAARVALGCARLRAQGTDTAAIPACR